MITWLKQSFSALGLSLALLACQSNSPSKPQDLPRAKVLITTPKGEMELELFNETPRHRDNFLKLVEEGFYDGLLIHFVQRNHILIGGAPDSKGARPDAPLGMLNLNYTLPPEIDSSFVPCQGMLGAYHFGPEMNPSLESSASQFFLVHGLPLKDYQLKEFEEKRGKAYSPSQREAYLRLGGTPSMEGQYTLFGRVTKGLNVLETLAELPTRERPFGRPYEDQVLQIRILDNPLKTEASK